jgi:hypothetical protein
MAAPSGSAAVSSSGTISSSSGSLASVVPWLRQMGIWWDDKLVDIRAGCSGCSGPDLGVFAVTDTTENQVGGCCNKPVSPSCSVEDQQFDQKHDYSFMCLM